MKQLAKAVLAVMEDVKGVDKSMTVGTGAMSYKGVSDKDVKTAIGRSMQKHGLVLLPTGVEDSVQVDRWEETSQYGTKQKQNINVSVKTKYLLLHESGESQEVVGYGHGIDPQDKAAGKATTYALKNLLLYMFLVPTGTIDDADKDHSDDLQVPPPKAQSAPPKKETPKAERIIVKDGDELYLKILKAVSEGKGTLEQAKGKYNISEAVEDSLKEKIAALSEIVG